MLLAHAGGLVEAALVVAVLALGALVWLHGRTRRGADEGEGEAPRSRSRGGGGG